MQIRTAETDDERRMIHDFLGQYFPLAPTAIPSVANNWLYQPIIPYICDDAGLVGAALTCRAQLAAGAAAMGPAASTHPRAKHYLNVVDRHSELDLLAVRPDARGNGVGSQLVDWMQGQLIKRGVRVWFGNVTTGLQVDALRRFYARHGFKLTGAGQLLPPLLGVQWVPPNAEPPAFFFYKVVPRIEP